jgi:hypothetical protein
MSIEIANPPRDYIYTGSSGKLEVLVLAQTWKHLQYICHFPYIYNNPPTNQGSPKKPQCTTWLHIHRKQWKTGSYTWVFLDIEEASDSTSCDITKAAKCHGPQTHYSDGLAPCWVAEKWQRHSQEKHWRGLWPRAVHRGALYTIAMKPGWRWSHRETQWEWLLYTGVYAILINGKFQNYVSQLLHEAFSMEQQCGETQISIHPQKVQYLDQYFSN